VSVPDPAQYDDFAAEYAAHAAVAPYNALDDRPATLGLIGDVAGRRILDAACGPGFYVDELLRRGAEVAGCDAAPKMIDLARARIGDRAELCVHSLDDPFTWVHDGSLDVVVCALAYHYVTNRGGFRRAYPDGVETHPGDEITGRRLGRSLIDGVVTGERFRAGVRAGISSLSGGVAVR